MNNKHSEKYIRIGLNIALQRKLKKLKIYYLKKVLIKNKRQNIQTMTLLIMLKQSDREYQAIFMTLLFKILQH
mgnify:CR=1 FL=1